MKKLQKVFALLLALSMAMSLMSVTAFAEGNASDQQIVEQGGKVYYLASGEEAGPDNFDVWTSKTIAGTDKEDEFEVTLQVGTTMKAVANDIAVVLVMDVSGSMMNDETGERWYDNNMPEGRKRRIEYTREAAQAFAEAYVERAGGSQRMLSVVQFGNTAQTLLPWTDANDGGVLNQEAAEALNNVEVNFNVRENVSYWDESIAMGKWGKVNYWDGSEADAVMKDLFKSYFQNYAQAATMTSRFVSYVEAGDSVCKYPECTDLSDGHTHCAFDGCAVAQAHDHCDVEGCVLTTAHFHCTKCDSTDAHTHCAFDGCGEAAEHTHCSYEGCTIAAAHTHCDRCGSTSADHTHIVGCTLSGCTDRYSQPHTHCCTHSRDCLIPYSIKYRWSSDYNYRCKNPDPDHTHDFWDSDTAYLTYSRYFGSVWAIGTNMEAGLLLARNLVSSGLQEGGAIEGIDNVYVILLSDGKPTWRTNETSTTELKAITDGDNEGTWPALKDIVVDGGENDIAIAKDIKDMADLYAIIYSNDLEAKFDLGAGHPLTGVSGAEWLTKSGDYYVGADAVFDSPEADGLDTAFLQINDRIDVLAKAWTVTDELSDDVTFGEFLLNGDYAGYTPASEGKAASVSWSLGNMTPECGTGGMADPYVYTLKYTVKLNSAQDDVKAISLAHDADPSLEGVWTGKSANLKYFMVEKNALDNMSAAEIARMTKDAAFEDVSVKGIYGGLSFIKKNGETDQPIEGVGFTLYNSEGKAYGEELFSDSEGKVVFTNVPRGSYTLKETTVPEGLEEMAVLGLLESWGNVTGNDGSAIPAVIYNYKPAENPGPGPGTNPGPSVTPDTKPDDTPIDDPDVPMGGEPEVEIPDEEVPKADAPKTGDASVLWLAMTALSGAGLFVTRRKKED